MSRLLSHIPLLSEVITGSLRAAIQEKILWGYAALLFTVEMRNHEIR